VSSLSISQRLILATAANRVDGAVLPLPDGFSVRGRARWLLLEGLIKRGLITDGTRAYRLPPGNTDQRGDRG
jgi:hypothetical protein